MCSRPAGPRRVHRLALTADVLVAVPTADPLVAAGAEGPASVFGRRPVAGQQHASHVGGHAGVIQRAVELVHSFRPEGVAHLRAVEGDAYGRAVCVADHLAVVGDVGKVEALHHTPRVCIEGLRDRRGSHSASLNAGTYSRLVGPSQLSVYAIGMRARFRRITVREGMLFQGPAGWAEFSPFLDYDATESAAWLAAAREAADIDRMASAHKDAYSSQRDGPGSRSGKGGRDRTSIRRLPYGQGEGRRARRAVGGRHRPGGGGPRRARPGRPDPGGRQWRLVVGRGS